MKIKIKFERIKVQTPIWLTILIFLIILLISTISFTITAYNTPTETTEPYTILTYGTTTRYNYMASLENNTVYEKTTLGPGQGILFKKIVDHINGSITATFDVNATADVTLTYSVIATVQTDLWQKTYTLIPSTTQTTSGTSLQISKQFPINYLFYDTLISQINEEIGINAPNPQLIIETPVTIRATASNRQISQSLTPQLTMSLTQKTIEFSEIFSERVSGSEVGTRQIYHPEVIETQRMHLTTTIVLSIILLIYLLLTKMKSSQISKIEKQLKKIQKKYGEWIVETTSKPIDVSNTISVKTIEDLSKIGEELGKPLIHYKSKSALGKDDDHIFYVLDEDTSYNYILKAETKIKNVVSCSGCGTKITAEGYTGEKVEITCPQCFKRTIVSIEKPGEKGFAKSLTSHLTHTESEEI